MRTSIVWFKTDLRLHDNETLIRAVAQSDEIVPVYCFDDAHFSTTNFGFAKTGNIRTQFLLESLADLDKNLRATGSGLMVVKGKPREELAKIALHYKAQTVFAQEEIAFEEMKTETAVNAALDAIGCSFETVGTSGLYDVDDLPFAIKEVPDVFTNFRKRVEKESEVRIVFNTPTFIKSPEISPLQLPAIEQLGLEKVVKDCRSAMQFEGGENAALARLHYYLFETGFISTYKETRNGLIGENYSTKFSPWLALGCLSARTIYHEIKKYEAQYKANESTCWVIFELLWRDYFRWMMMKYGNHFFLPNGIKNTQNAGVRAIKYDLLQTWINGQTGVDFVDANMLELKLTGFMSNRGRQNVASYLCNDMKLDWRLGAAYFEQQLIDYDVCSNWGNWAYVAGVGNDPRENRYFNIEKQSAVYDKDQSYRNLWLQKI